MKSRKKSRRPHHRRSKPLSTFWWNAIGIAIALGLTLMITVGPKLAGALVTASDTHGRVGRAIAAIVEQTQHAPHHAYTPDSYRGMKQ